MNKKTLRVLTLARLGFEPPDWLFGDAGGRFVAGDQVGRRNQVFHLAM